VLAAPRVISKRRRKEQLKCVLVCEEEIGHPDESLGMCADVVCAPTQSAPNLEARPRQVPIRVFFRVTQTKASQFSDQPLRAGESLDWRTPCIWVIREWMTDAKADRFFDGLVIE
jgi:hypothetical protein